MDKTPYTYLFIRQDLPIETQIVQSAHAAHSAGESFGQHSHLIAFGAKSEQALLAIADRMTEHGIRYEMFFEPDNDVGYTAICTSPLTGDDRKPMRKYSLLKSNPSTLDVA